MAEKYVHIYTLDGLVNAQLMREFLRSKGIHAEVFQESAGIVHGLTIGPLGEGHVYVPESEKEEALAILAAMERGEYELPASPEEDLAADDEEETAD